MQPRSSTSSSEPNPDARALFAALRLRTHSRTPGARAGSSTRESLLAFYDRGRSLNAIHEHLNGQAQLFAFRDPKVWFGGPCVIAIIDRAPAPATNRAPATDRAPARAPATDRAPGSDDAILFLRAALERHKDLLDDDTLLEIPADDPALLHLAIEHGFGIDSAILVGSPSTARARLPTTPLPNDLTLVPLCTDHVAAVIALHRSAFSAHPEHCWFGAYPSHLQRLAESLNSDPSGQLVLLQQTPDGQDHVLGHVGVTIDPDNAFWGSVGGLELVLADRLHGQGLARPIYSRLLDLLLAAGCEVMKGGTSQPAVLHLGRELGRPWHSLNLRRETRFPPEHFLRFAPPALQRLHGVTR